MDGFIIGIIILLIIIIIISIIIAIVFTTNTNSSEESSSIESQSDEESQNVEESQSDEESQNVEESSNIESQNVEEIGIDSGSNPESDYESIQEIETESIINVVPESVLNGDIITLNNGEQYISVSSDSTLEGSTTPRNLQIEFSTNSDGTEVAVGTPLMNNMYFKIKDVDTEKYLFVLPGTTCIYSWSSTQYSKFFFEQSTFISSPSTGVFYNDSLVLSVSGSNSCGEGYAIYPVVHSDGSSGFSYTLDTTKSILWTINKP